LIGTGALAVQAASNLRQDGGRMLMGAVDTRLQREMGAAFPEIPYLGRLTDLGSVIVEHCIDEVQVALPVKSCLGEFAGIHEIGKALGIPVVFRVQLLECAPVRTQSGFDGSACVVYNDHPANRGRGRLAKRVIDILIAGGALLLVSPLLILIAIAVKLTSRGPVFFKQPRVGFRRREFRMWKFRTMVRNAEQLRKEVAVLNSAKGISFKIVRDPRLTRIGGFLRRTSLDELPQLFNILFGEMSLVGPRPIPVWVADQLDDAAYYRRFHVAPGLTGWWQVEGREQDFERMAEQDLYYVDNWSHALDLKILLNTIPAVLKGHGAH